MNQMNKPTPERSLYIIDHIFDLLIDTMGFENAINELKVNYNLKFTEEELAYLKRGMA